MSASFWMLQQPWVERLGSTLLHFIWQGALIAVIYATIRRALSTSTSNARYVLACGALAFMVAAPVMTITVLTPSESEQVVQARQRLSRVPVGDSGSVNATMPAKAATTSWVVWHESRMGWVVVVWFIGATAFSLRLTGGWITAVCTRSLLARAAPPEWQQTLQELTAKVGLRRSVRLLISARVHAPAVIGWLRPAVLVPVGFLTGLPSDYVEALLVHELAHVRRHDYLVNALQNICEALLFYHPAVWWISQQIRAERELCCDDVVVSLNGDALTYARALAELELQRPNRLHAAVAANGGSLEQRIGRLLGQSRSVSYSRAGSSVILSAIVLTVTAYVVFGQTPELPRFEVASVKLNTNPGQGVVTGAVNILPGGRLTATAALPQFLIQQAYGIRRYQLSGGPDWLGSAHYDIEAKAAENATPQQVLLMLQALLEERFKLKVHRDTKELPVYEISVAQDGIKLQPSKSDCLAPEPNSPRPPQPTSSRVPSPPCGIAGANINRNAGVATIRGNNVSMERLALTLSNLLGRTVIDKTRFTEKFDLELKFAPDEALAGLQLLPPPPAAINAPVSAPDPNLASIFTAMEQQLGLKLQSAKGPVDVLVIDHIERPTQN